MTTDKIPERELCGGTEKESKNSKYSKLDIFCVISLCVLAFGLGSFLFSAAIACGELVPKHFANQCVAEVVKTHWRKDDAKLHAVQQCLK